MYNSTLNLNMYFNHWKHVQFILEKINKVGCCRHQNSLRGCRFLKGWKNAWNIKNTWKKNIDRL